MMFYFEKYIVVINTIMFIIKCIILLLLALTFKKYNNEGINFNFQQNDYKIKFERAETIRYNKEYVYYFKTKTFKYNRTSTAFNFTFRYKIDVRDNVQVIVQAFKFASNEYRLFPIRFQHNLCTVFKFSIAGFADFLKCKNFDGCPNRKNRAYEICNFMPNENKFPPFIPSGRYMVEMTGMYYSTEIWIGRGYAEVFRPIVP